MASYSMDRESMFDERKYAGQEHIDPEIAARFDEKLPFDPSSEVDLLLEFGLTRNDTVVDFGTGTGKFPLAIAGHCDQVVATDVYELHYSLTADAVHSLG